MAARTIAFDPMDFHSIAGAIVELNRFKDDMMRACNDVLNHLAYRGAENAKQELRIMIPANPYRTYDIVNTIRPTYTLPPTNRVASVDAPVEYAAFVEYGTGTVGASQGHPTAFKEGWAYDVNSHDLAGWTYYNNRDGKMHNTAGYEARPFMYMTKLYLVTDAPKVTQRVFANF